MNEPCIQNETPLEPSEPPLTRTHRWNQIKRTVSSSQSIFVMLLRTFSFLSWSINLNCLSCLAIHEMHMKKWF
ncbi:hypothetical protein P8452_42129 [Trifolium repens]|nr:hypothetical protein QL285_026423 [Trifolium repens]WJX56470.1 hypothetical protein P8452_42129 [Trifolium repens]